jgi:hypothetical protein
MLDATWSPSLLLVALLLSLGAVGISAWLVLRRLEALRRRTEERLDDLSRRLRLVEADKSEGENRFLTPKSVTPKPADRPDSENRFLPPKLVTPKLASQREADEPGPTLIAVPDLAEEDRPLDPQVETELRERHGEIWALAATGKSSEEIARQTGQPIGHVELIVGLYRQMHSQRGPLGHARSH